MRTRSQLLNADRKYGADRLAYYKDEVWEADYVPHLIERDRFDQKALSTFHISTVSGVNNAKRICQNRSSIRQRLYDEKDSPVAMNV